MRRLLAILVAALVALLIVPTASVATAAVSVAQAWAYNYDGHHNAEEPTYPATERGPPAVRHSYALLPFLDDHGSRGASTRPQWACIWSYTTYDHLAQLEHGDRIGVATRTASGRRFDDRCTHSGARCAANAGPRALSVGPWGQKIVDARTRLPSSWGPGTPNAKGVGTRWFDSADRGNGVRIDQGIPGSSYASQQVDHVVVRSGGRILGPDGKPIVGPLSQNPQAHIPLSDWLTWSSWSTP